MNLWLKRYFRNKVEGIFIFYIYKHLLNLVKIDNIDSDEKIRVYIYSNKKYLSVSLD